MTAPTAEEGILIHQLRSRVADLELQDDSDMFLIRWLRGRDLKLNQAEAMLRKHVDWCKENDIDNILAWEPLEILKKDYVIEILGKDSENCPNAAFAFGKWDLKKIYDSGLKGDFIRYTDQLYFKLLDLMKGQYGTEGVPVTQFNIVYDAEGLSMKLLTSVGAMEMSMDTLRRFEANHPETLKACYVINASKVFSIIFSIVKPLLSQRTFGKVHIFDSNASKWIPALQKAIPLEILPVSYGGYNSKSSLNSSTGSREGYDSVKIPAGGSFPLQLNVTDTNTVLSWSFFTSNHDIGFSLKSKNEELVKYVRVEASKKPQEGSFICNQPGTYTLFFDNSYSHLRAKEISYKVNLENCAEK